MCFSCKMCRLEKESGGYWKQIFKNSLLNSLLAGNLGRERLAPDCLLRHAVCSAEKPACNSWEIARIGRNCASLSRKADRRKCPAQYPTQALQPFSPEGIRAVRFQRLHQANAMRC